MKGFCLRFICWLPWLLVFSFSQSSAQRHVLAKSDSLFVKAGILVILPDTFYVTTKDTVLSASGKSIRLRKDPYARSKTFYDSLAVHSGKSRMKKELYRLFIKDNSPVKVVRKNDVVREEAFERYSGMTVRTVTHLKTPVLDGNVNDTAWVTQTRLGRWMNFHAQTKSSLVLARSLVQPGDVVDEVVLADMERLVREIETIRDAKLYVLPVPGSDSIDLVIATQDYIPVRLNMELLGTDNFSVGLTDRNIAGIALEAGMNYRHKSSFQPDEAWSVFLRKDNLLGQFGVVRAEVSSIQGKEAQSLELERTFLSEELPDLGGVYVRRVRDKWAVSETGKKFDLVTTGGWYGRVFSNRSHWNLIPMMAMDIISFQDRPFSGKDADYTLWNKLQLVGAVQIIKREFIRSALVKEYGVSEYFPVGVSFRFTGGKDITEVYSRNYFGGEFALSGFQKDAGYYGVKLAAGSFFRNNLAEDARSSVEVYYFTPLLKWNRVRFRQFLKVDFLGEDRLSTLSPQVYSDQRLDLNDPVYGDVLVKSNLTTVWHMPWYLFGFRFAFFDGVDLISVRDKYKESFRHFPVWKAGVNIQNDFLAYNTLSFQFQYLPEVEKYRPVFSVTLKSMLVPVFSGLTAGRPSFGIR